jgi:FG-GAP-like repeat/ASPIC and UnbV/Secretion system C-terminal sorting domain
MHIRLVEYLLIFLLFEAQEAYAQFFEITNSEGIYVINTGTYDGNGTSFKDFNSDGWDDVTFGTVNGMPRFFENNAGDLEEVYFELPNYQNAQIKGLQWVDFDNDGDQDLFIAYSGSPVRLYRNNGLQTFSDITTSAGIVEEYVDHFGSAWSDVDKDGFLDLYISKYSSIDDTYSYEYTNRFYHNNGDGTFSDYTVLTNLDGTVHSCFQPIFFDYNGDNFQDLYVLIDREVESNILFKNNGNGTFSNMSSVSGANIAVDAMGGSVDDYDNDGDMDIYVSNSYDGNVLLRNNGNGTFSDVSPYYDLQVNQICWGDMWLDYNNDTHKDLWVSTTINNWESSQNLFFVNNGDNTFTEDIYSTGIEGDLDPTFSCSMGDLNKDGYYDFITNNNDPRPSSIWQSVTGVNNSLSVTLTGTVSNRDAIGTWLQCYVNGHLTVNHLLNSENYLGQNAQREIFGCGISTMVDSLVIRWPSGLIETYYDIVVPSLHHFIEGALQNSNIEVYSEGDLVLCPGETLTLTCEESSNYQWNNGQQTQSITISEPGTYFVQSTNDFGFIVQSDTLVVTSSNFPQLYHTIYDVSCFQEDDGTILIETAEELEILWSNGSAGYTLSNVSAGWQTYNITNSSNCVFEDSLYVSQPDSISYFSSTTPVLCHGENSGIAQIEITGGIAPYNLVFDNVDSNALFAGTHCFTIWDSHLCVQTGCIEINEPEELVVEISSSPQYENGPSGTANLLVTGGTPPFDIIWSNGFTNTSNLTELNSGVYSVFVEDSNGCQIEAIFTIDWIVGVYESPVINFQVYPSPFSNVLRVDGPSDNYNITIFDPSGRIIYSENPCIPRTEINSFQWEAGIYFVQINSEKFSGVEWVIKK